MQQGYSPFGPPQAQPPPPSRGPWIIVLVVGLIVVALMVVAGAGAIMAFRMHRGKAKAVATKAATVAAWSDTASPVPISSDDPMHGDRDALVTMVVFGDLQDPFTKRLTTTIDSLESLYGHGDLRVVWKNDPLAFHTHAHEAAEAARGVFEQGGSDAFFQFAHRCVDDQSALRASSYRSWAATAGVNGDDVVDGLSAGKWTSRVDDDATLAKSLGVTGTPTSFINGVKVSGAQPLSTFQTTIDTELARARTLVASGVARDHVYVRASTTAFAAPKPKTTATTKSPSPPMEYVAVGDSPTLGPKTALVTIVEFSDLQCPYCLKADATMRQLRTTYGDSLRIVWKNDPLRFHTQAAPAAEVALEARARNGEAAFWSMHDAIFAKQGGPGGTSGFRRDDLLDVAATHGVPRATADSAITLRKHGHEIDGDIMLAKSLGVTGVPTFFINGRRLSGAQPYAKFESVVEDELSHAKRLVASGTPRSQVYEAALASNTGLRVTTTRAGSGRAAVFGDEVSVRYTGKLDSGKVFDEHASAPFPFALGENVVIKGWEYGLVGARKGEKRTLVIPPDLAYGSAGRPPTIPPSATLTFEMEVVSVDEQ